jgi:hypothetical protein
MVLGLVDRYGAQPPPELRQLALDLLEHEAAVHQRVLATLRVRTRERGVARGVFVS